MAKKNPKHLNDNNNNNNVILDWASLVTQMVKNLPAVQETRVQSLGREDPLEKGMNGHPLQYYCLENTMGRGACWATVHGVARSQKQLSN